ncbi:hypothetical protein ACFLZN_02635 [Nanoarchaeota archaeon]
MWGEYLEAERLQGSLFEVISSALRDENYTVDLRLSFSELREKRKALLDCRHGKGRANLPLGEFPVESLPILVDKDRVFAAKQALGVGGLRYFLEDPPYMHPESEAKLMFRIWSSIDRLCESGFEVYINGSPVDEEKLRTFRRNKRYMLAAGQSR